MQQNSSKMLIGAIVAAALAVAVYYGLISQQQASSIQTQANQTLGTSPAAQQSTTPASVPASQTPTTTQSPNGAAAPNVAPTSR